ncbi:hypothetical protein JIN85_17800 [Luteolibacter pohnpeiensis]|uniref:Uncharacterized protein n=1 Tax=Luteolibacter pohnpeiensis TaxID=454153 RepID=A0A934S9G6_9BACT|nr:hypothetical protein [Luteolibacter pohnpeiensis]
MFPFQETEIEDVSIHVPYRVDRVLQQECGTHAIAEPFYKGWRFNALSRCWEPGGSER